MKNTCRLFILILLMGMFSCEKDPSKHTGSYLKYLEGKSILSIDILDGKIYIFTSEICDTCYQPPYISSLPSISQWVVIGDSSTWETYSPYEFSRILEKDNEGNLYLAQGNSIYRVKDNGEEELFLNTGDFIFWSFTFGPQDDLWLWGDMGIAHKEGEELTVFDTENSILPSDIIHGLAVDDEGIVWVSADFGGLVKIQDDSWTIIPNEDIPGLSNLSYLMGPKIINEHGVWFEVFNPDTTSGILRYKGDSWVYEFPDNTTDCSISLDSGGRVWAISNHFGEGICTFSSLKYFSNGRWKNFDVSDINRLILSVNADDKKVYIGTGEGLVEKLW